MNSLAAYFVAEMDEYVYQYLCPPAIQSVLEDPDRFPSVRKRTANIDTVVTDESIAELNKIRATKLKAAMDEFAESDFDANGKLNEHELLDLFSELGFSSLRAPEIRQVIMFCDKDGDGTVSRAELEWLLTAPLKDESVQKEQQASFHDEPDVRVWLQKEFVTQQDTCWNSGACSKCMTMLMTLVPMVRIITILGLTASLIATYCDDFNPLDKYFRGVTNATCTYCPSATSSG